MTEMSDLCYLRKPWLYQLKLLDQRERKQDRPIVKQKNVRLITALRDSLKGNQDCFLVVSLKTLDWHNPRKVHFLVHKSLSSKTNDYFFHKCLKTQNDEELSVTQERDYAHRLADQMGILVVFSLIKCIRCIYLVEFIY